MTRDPDWRKLYELLDDHTRCRKLLATYFGPLLLKGKDGYTGSRFESFAGGGDREPDRDRFVADDLVAVSLLSVDVPGRAALYLLDDPDGTLGAALRAIPSNVDLAYAAAEHLAAAQKLWDEVYQLSGVKRTKTSKLLARKRPRLIPVQDSRTMAALGEPTRFWKPLQHELGRGLHDRLIKLRQDLGVPTVVSAIRVLDILLWMEFHGPDKGLRGQ